jgi:ATP-dependent RNA helicase DeaD
VKFSDLTIHPALAAALSARGYETPTGVQAAVLDAACRGRDLLVSSHTGSGKTIAFGAAMAESLLAEGETRVPHGPNPLALVIVPTRELAVQVREELRWLFASAHLRLASFTGGTPVFGDLKALERGVELVIGTPGRLVDLLRRERLKLADLRVVVLDEADEMLDLGFRQDLETLLQAAPATRRTLLLSATLPPEIRALARKYQRDAVAIDPRKTGASPSPGGAAHEDITHRAHLIAGGDRLAAVVNVLRAEETTTRAIVFCTTREGVAEMHAALSARGFAATAISGDRAQAERDRALEQLRRGDARVLVATNVAARGLHLPDVDLIVHADLPLNADSLIHRSGRTGRAGRKGTAVVIASAAERRKAERLLHAAHVRVEWTPPPSAEAIAAAARARLAEELARGEEPPAAALQAADDLLERVEQKLPARELLRRLLSRELDRLPAGETLRATPTPTAGAGGAPPSRKRSHGEFARQGVAFRINIGAQDRADPRWLLPLICRRGGVTRREVGAIRVGPHETTFEIAGDAAHDFALAAAEPDPRARHVVIARADGPVAAARTAPRAPERPVEPARAPAPPREAHQRPRPHPQPSRAAEQPRAHQPPHPAERPRLPGGYHPLQRRVPRKDAPEHPRPHPQPRPHDQARPHAHGKPPGRPRPHPAGKQPPHKHRGR